MKSSNKKTLLAAILTLSGFALWTLLVSAVDVSPIGPLGSEVGFATLNGAFHRLTGVHWTFYLATDWMGLVPFAVVVSFAVLGLLQWIGRKSLWRVDRDLLALGVFYVAVLTLYLLFEIVVINRRPALIDGVLEASYPSSTTVLVLCVMPTALMLLRPRIKHNALRLAITAVTVTFVAVTLILRILSGVHWITDIIGGMLLSVGLVLLYRAAVQANSHIRR